MTASSPLERARGTLLTGRIDGHRPATPLELFFDLCFVVAVAQVAKVLHHDPTLTGALISAGLFVGIWWAWMAVTWHAAALDRGDALYRVNVLAAMLAVLILAVGVPDAAAGDAALYAVAAGMLRLPLIALWLRDARDPESGVRGFTRRYALGNAWGATWWLASALVEGELRYAMWAVALIGEIAAPYAAARVATRPFYHPDHIVERYGLFTIIVLGESVLAVVVGLDAVAMGTEEAVTAAVGFAGAAALWWLYFDHVGQGGLGASRRAGFLWGYGHLAIWSGIVAYGVGVHLAVERSGAATYVAASDPAVGSAATSLPPLALLGAGPALALCALAVIAWSGGGTSRRATAPRLIAAALLGGLAAVAGLLGPLIATATAAAVLVGLVLVERAVSGAD